MIWVLANIAPLPSRIQPHNGQRGVSKGLVEVFAGDMDAFGVTILLRIL